MEGRLSIWLTVALIFSKVPCHKSDVIQSQNREDTYQLLSNVSGVCAIANGVTHECCFVAETKCDEFCCKNYCNNDSSCKGYVFNPAQDLCVFYTTSLCPTGSTKHKVGLVGEFIPGAYPMSGWSGCYKRITGIRTVQIIPNHASLIINKDEPYDLVCNAPNADIKRCLFTTPSGNIYILWAGASYESGRITQVGDGVSTCAVYVKKAQYGDNGKWTCQISTMDQNNNAVTSSADLTVTVAGKDPIAEDMKLSSNSTKNRISKTRRNSLSITIGLSVTAIIFVAGVVICIVRRKTFYERLSSLSY